MRSAPDCSGDIVPVRVAASAGAGPDAAAAVDAALTEVRGSLSGPRVDALFAFVGAAYADAAELVAARLAQLQPRACAGVTVQGVVAGAAEIEHAEAVSIWAVEAPGLEVEALRFPAPGDGGVEWPDVPPGAQALVAFADPFTFPPDAFLAWAQQRHPGLVVSGGLASGGQRAGANRLLLDGVVHTDGAVGLALGAGVEIRTLVSQGCRPVGAPFVVTGAEGNLITELAGAPPIERLRDVYGGASAHDRALMESGLHLGVVIDEYAELHERGSFLVRGVLGAQPGTGALAVGDALQVGQTVRFHVRDADSADEDLRELLDRFRPGGAAGALLFTCNGRGARLFGAPDHDAGLVRAALGDVPLAGFFAAGEFGPVGGRSHLHGFTASLLAIGANPEM